MIEFEYELQIKEAHLDTFGHVNNATYLTLYEEARWDFIHKRGFGLKEVIDRKMGPVLLDAKIKFRKELSNREKITIKSKPLKMAHKLIMQMEQSMIKENGEVASTMLMSVGLMDTAQRKLIPPTPEWLHAIGYEED